MRKRKVFLVASLVLLLLGLSACQEPCTPCPPSALEGTVVVLETEVAVLETEVATLESALATCEATPPNDDGPPDCVEKPPCHADAISAKEAKDYVGEIKIVQGRVVDAKYASGSSGQPTFLNLCYPYPDPRRFTALIWGEDRQEFIDCLGGPPEQVLLTREVCVEGLIEPYKDISEIILTECGQLTVIQ